MIFKGKPAIWNRNEQLASRAQNTADLASRTCKIRNVLECLDGYDGIEVRIGESHRRG
jgi:hypothetical protein